MEILERKFKLYSGGRSLRIEENRLSRIDKTRKELGLLDQLYGLYVDDKTIEDWKNILWINVASNMEMMGEKIDSLERSVPTNAKKLRDWEAYTVLFFNKSKISRQFCHCWCPE